MQLTGDLSDFALTDILQILSLSRKTGVVLLNGGGLEEGKIIVESGRITHASARPGKSLSDSLMAAGVLKPEILKALTPRGESIDSQLEKLLHRGGVLNGNGLASAVRRHTQRVIGDLVALEKGHFRIALGEGTLPRPEEGFRLAEGLDVGEALLSAAHDRDESDRDSTLADSQEKDYLSLSRGKDTSLLLSEDRPEPPVNSPRAASSHPRNDESLDRSELLCSLLAEMKQHSFEAEVSLLLMRYASALAARGILFAVRGSNLYGLGQFGLNQRGGKSADEMVRQLSFPLVAHDLFERVVRTSEPYVGPMPDNYFVADLLSRFGGSGYELRAFVLPLTYNESPAYVLYCDNYPGNYELNGLTELVALATQASLALERIALHRRVIELETK